MPLGKEEGSLLLVRQIAGSLCQEVTNELGGVLGKLSPDDKAPPGLAAPAAFAQSATREQISQRWFNEARGVVAWIGWQTMSGYSIRGSIEIPIGRCALVIGNRLRRYKGKPRVTQVAVAVLALSRMLDLGRPGSVRIAQIQTVAELL
jgi:hypothetical protein